MKSKLWQLARDEKGFTLIELFTAIVLLTIGLLGTAALTAGVVKGNSAGRNVSTATSIAQSCFQENRRVGYINAGTATNSNGCTTTTTNVASGGVTFARALSIDSSVTNIKTLTVTVTWNEGSAGGKSLKMMTSIASGT
jgi:prepilin-type N-terminal cleavage/methylation domain-containing protein